MSAPQPPSDSHTQPITSQRPAAVAPPNTPPLATTSSNNANVGRVIAIVVGGLVACMMLGGAALATTLVAAGAAGAFDGSGVRGLHRGSGGGEDGPGFIQRRRGGQDTPGRDSGNSPGQGGPMGQGGPRGQGGPTGRGGPMGQGGAMGAIPGGISAIQHGEIVIEGGNGQPQTIRIVRGAVTAVSDTSITVTSTDGFAGTFAVDAATKVERNNDAATTTQIVVGDTATVSGPLVGATATAQRINAADAATASQQPDQQPSQLPKNS